MAAYRHAIALQPTDSSFRVNLGSALSNRGLQLLHEAGDPDGAAASFRSSLEIDPNQQDAPRHLATLYRRAGMSWQGKDRAAVGPVEKERRGVG